MKSIQMYDIFIHLQNIFKYVVVKGDISFFVLKSEKYTKTYYMIFLLVPIASSFDDEPRISCIDTDTRLMRKSVWMFEWKKNLEILFLIHMM